MEVESANFDFYKNNIKNYYNSDIIIKLINDGVTNIPPSMKEMFLVYETNSSDIKSFNAYYYNKHIELIDQMKNRLFEIKDNQIEKKSTTKKEVSNFLKKVLETLLENESSSYGKNKLSHSQDPPPSYEEAADVS